MRSLLSKMYSCPATWYLRANAGIALVFLLANGGAFAVALSQPAHSLSGQTIAETAVSLPIALLVLITSVFTWFRPAASGHVLRIQSLVLLLLVAYVSSSAAAQFAPATQGLKDFWVVGYFTLLVFYTAVVLVRFGLRELPASGSASFYSPVIIGAVALVVDAAIFIQAIRS